MGITQLPSNLVCMSRDTTDNPLPVHVNIFDIETLRRTMLGGYDSSRADW